MEKLTPAIKSKLERIAENAEMIIRSYDVTDSLKSAYNAVNDDWKSLEGKLKNWKQIQFTNNDFTTVAGLCLEKFTENCKTNMRTIEGICKDTLAEIKENESKKDVEKTIKKPKLNTGHWLAIIGILVAVFFGITSQILETRYDQGKQDARNELTNTLNDQQNAIQNLLDSLEKLKLRNTELEKCIKLKKTCK